MSSLLPLTSNSTSETTNHLVSYGTSSSSERNNNNNQEEDETTELLVGVPGKPEYVEFEVAEVIHELFLVGRNMHWQDLDQHPKANPKRPPEKRFKRHRNYYIYHLNQFRHWWKTSRLLVRTSGGYEYCLDALNWERMAWYTVHKRKQARHALKSMKLIGRGGTSRDFLKNVKPFTRTIRIVLAVARGWEARKDNRLYEVGIAEAFAFMGNRCSRFVARHLVDGTTKYLALPLSAQFLEPYLDQNSRPVIVTLGFIRTVLPFSFSFTGSAIGRQLTFNTYKFANYRWKPVQSVMAFDQNAGVYQDTVLDTELELLAHTVAVAIGHGKDPVETRENMAKLGFSIFGAGQGGYAAYRRQDLELGLVFLVHVTPYGPSILDEMPRYIVLERRRLYYSRKNRKDMDEAHILDAATRAEATIYGYSYSGAFFKNQEWAALTLRFEETLVEYKRACQCLGTVQSLKGKDAIHIPPTDLLTLKEFIRSGHLPKKKRKDARRWKQLDHEIARMSALVAKYQKQGTAPKRVILYLEGLDCSAKSSTGGLICKALEDCGYAVRTAQHNRPPDAEQRKKPWMDRGRFEYPDDVYGHDEEIPEYTALVWDRGPGGDFVYGKFSELNTAAKMEKHEEFRAYDAKCREEGVLFCKLLFVADKDSIASTLGKRLAHKKIARDLRSWLDANSVEHVREGLEEIEIHIDPTDFVAFNQFKRNLSIFTEFARNTDKISEYSNPWTVVNTCKRHPARLGLLQTFERKLKQFAETPEEGPSPSLGSRLVSCFPRVSHVGENLDRPVPKNYVEDQHQGLSIRAILQSILLVGLLYFYAYITWKFDLQEYA